MNVYGYNRDAWMNDAQVHQARRYQKQQILLSQAGMFREDIRELVGASVTRQNNYVIIATLILGMMGECFIEGPIVNDAPEYLKTVYLVCTGGSLLYLVLTVICAVGANHLAVTCQRDMLLQSVRLPIEEMVEDLEEAATQETVEAFEHQSLKSMLRIPGMSRVAPSHVGSRGPKPPYAWKSDANTNSIQNMEEVRKRHLSTYYEKEHEWNTLDYYASVFGALGVLNLLQGYGYFAAAKAYEGTPGQNEFSTATVQCLVTVVADILGKAFSASVNAPRCLQYLEVFCIIGAQLFSFVSIRAEEPWWVDRVCVPMVMFCHLLVGVLGCHKLRSGVAAVWTSHHCSAESNCSSSSEKLPAPVKGVQCGDTPRASVRKQRRHRVVLSGSVVVLFMWLACFFWTVDLTIRQDPDNGDWSLVTQFGGNGAKTNSGRKLRGSSNGQLAPLTNFNFRPHALACGPRYCLLANEFLVYKLLLSSDDATPLSRVPCKVTGGIVDVAISCSVSGRCRHLALTTGGASTEWLGEATTIVDCATGVPEVLSTATGRVHRFAYHGQNALFTAHDKRVLEHGSSTDVLAHPSWEPLWQVTATRADLGSIDVTNAENDSLLVSFHQSGNVELSNVASGLFCGSWRLATGPSSTLLAGSIPFQNHTVMALLQARSGRVSLIRKDMPDDVVRAHCADGEMAMRMRT
jgi:hypothetical protein